MSVLSLENLLEILPAIARITGGYAAVTDNQGRRIKTYDSQGQEIHYLKGMLFDLAKTAAQTGNFQTGFSQIIDSAELWALPLGDYVLAANNIERIQRDKDLKNSLIKALPFIARVAGGEAVLFDKEGRRLASIDYHGNVTERFIGSTSKAAKEAMATQKTVIGESMSVNGAIGVRIPITKDFGFGFNNEQSVQQEHKLIEEVKKFQYARYNFNDIIGESEAIKKTKSMASFIAKGISSVLIYGETGTGKELFAQAIHNNSERRSQPFVAINCGAIPASIIESYLFGYEGGSFTGAKKGGNSGAFEQANGGTIFFDEISEMDYNLQSKLLRVLQEREVMRIGSTRAIKIDVRIIAATNKNLVDLIKKAMFREDLFYRLNVVQIKLPTLRERIEDLPTLVKFFINKYNKLLGKFVTGIDIKAENLLISFHWPGNVRQLQNCIEYAMNMVDVNDSAIEVEHLPSYIQDSHPKNIKMTFPSLADVICKAEKEAIIKALHYTNGSKKETATILDISTTTLWRKICEHKIE
ncbi:MAG: sigma-54 interaction domain-containing protein [Peptococcaceae bacterium]